MRIARILLLSCLLCCIFTQVQAVESNPTDCKSSDVGCVKKQFGVDSVENVRYGTWSPRKGGVFFYGRSTGYYSSFDRDTFIFYLYFDRETIRFYERNPWAAIELDIIFAGIYNYTVPRIDPKTVAGTEGTMPLRDTIVEAPNKKPATRGITVINPSAMKVGWNMFTFALKDNFWNISDVPVRVYVDVQLVANALDWSFVKALYEYNSFSWATKRMAVWGSVAKVGHKFSLGGEVFKYFTMDRATQTSWNRWYDDENKEWKEAGEKFRISKYTAGKGFYWTDRKGAIDDVATKIDIEDFLGQVIEPSDFVVNEPIRESLYRWYRKVSKSKLTRYLKTLIQQVQSSINDEYETDPDPEVKKGGKDKDRRSVDVDTAKVRASSSKNNPKHKRLTVESGEHLFAWIFAKNKKGNSYGNEVFFYLDGGDKLHLNRREKDLVASRYVGTLYSKEEVWFGTGFYAPEVDKEEKFTLYACIDTASDDKKPTNNCSGLDKKGRKKREEFAYITVKPKWQDSNDKSDDPIIADPIDDDEPVKDPDDDPVVDPAKPTITVTSPAEGEEWRGDPDVRFHIEWTSTNLDLEDRVKVEVSTDGGDTWELVDDTAVNDGGKFWEACLTKTADTSDAYIKVTLLSDPSVYGMVKFKYDHAKGCN